MQTISLLRRQKQLVCFIEGKNNQCVKKEESNFSSGGKGKSACNGDSGGPLVCQGEDSKWYQVAVSSN